METSVVAAAIRRYRVDSEMIRVLRQRLAFNHRPPTDEFREENNP